MANVAVFSLFFKMDWCTSSQHDEMYESDQFKFTFFPPTWQMKNSFSSIVGHYSSKCTVLFFWSFIFLPISFAHFDYAMRILSFIFSLCKFFLRLCVFLLFSFHIADVQQRWLLNNSRAQINQKTSLFCCYGSPLKVVIFKTRKLILWKSGIYGNSKNCYSSELDLLTSHIANGLQK